MNTPNSPNRLSASIVLFNTPRHLLQKVYQSVLRSGLLIELYLIDNSPTPCLDPSEYPEARYQFIGRNLGYGAGHNIALRKVLDTSTYHFVLNPDIYFEAPTLPGILQFMDGDPTIGQVMPQIRYPNGEIQYLCKLIPSPIDLLARRFLPASLRFILDSRMNRFELRDTGYETVMDVPYLSGCFMALRVDALRKIGLFDERFFMYPEDIDLTRRIAEYYRTTYFPDVQVIHDHARESYRSIRMSLIHMKNLILYFNKCGWLFDKKRKLLNKNTLHSINKRLI